MTACWRSRRVPRRITPPIAGKSGISKGSTWCWSAARKSSLTGTGNAPAPIKAVDNSRLLRV